MRCSASVHGTWPTSQVFGGVIEKSSRSASGTACRLISRSSIANGWPSASCRQRTASTVARPPTPRRALSCAEAARLRRSSSRVVIAFAAFLDLPLEIGNLQDRRLHARPRHEAAGPAAAHHQACLGERRHDLVHGHPRTGIGFHQFVFERHTMPRRPVAGHDTGFEIAADPLIERRRPARRAWVSRSCGQQSFAAFDESAARRVSRA